jgi:membrane peptidoglycan carboxypeptidase
VIAASVAERQEVYRWLFKTRHPKAQEKRIRSLVEQEAFARVHEAWKRVGYPFDTLTPSYATAIGASGDRPAALAELTGIIMNNGTRLPVVRFEDLHFAADTPYETVMQAPVARGRQVLLPAVAAAARSALIDVVEKGTAKRLSGQFKAPDGTPLVVAGKTGTGDHRREIFGARGRRIATDVKSRAAVFTFMLGDRMYGVLTAYVTGRSAARYHFTSALPAQVLKSLVPTLSPMLHRAYAQPESTESYTLSSEVSPAKL